MLWRLIFSMNLKGYVYKEVGFQCDHHQVLLGSGCLPIFQSSSSLCISYCCVFQCSWRCENEEDCRSISLLECRSDCYSQCSYIIEEQYPTSSTRDSSWWSTVMILCTCRHCLLHRCTHIHVTDLLSIFGFCESPVVLRATVRKLPPMWRPCERLSTMSTNIYIHIEYILLSS